MKNYFFLLISFLLIVRTQAQDEVKGAIYSLSFFVDQELTTERSIHTDNRNFLNGMSESEIFPDNLKDSIMIFAERKLSKEFKMGIEAIRPKERKGISFGPSPGYIDGLPFNMLNKMLKQEKKYEKYFDISFHVYPSGGVEIDLPGGKRSKVKPKVDMIIRVFDQNKNKIWKQDITLKKFGKLRQISKNNGRGVTVKESETLSPEDLYSMYVMTMEELFNQEKK